jgi:hypothetical protein
LKSDLRLHPGYFLHPFRDEESSLLKEAITWFKENDYTKVDKTGDDEHSQAESLVMHHESETGVVDMWSIRKVPSDSDSKTEVLENSVLVHFEFDETDCYWKTKSAETDWDHEESSLYHKRSPATVDTDQECDDNLLATGYRYMDIDLVRA